MMPPDPPPDRERGKKTTINLQRERQMWAEDMSTTAGDVSQFSVRYEYLLLARPTKVRC